MIILDYTDLSNLSNVISQVISIANKYKIWAFYGEMGTGKTTLIAELVRQLNGKNEASSPTFSIINEYSTQNEKSIFHFDFYRIKDIRELMELGVEEYFDQAEYVFIEWAEIFEPVLQYYDYIKIELIVNEKGNRLMYLYV